MLLSANVETLMKTHDVAFAMDVFVNAGFTALDFPLWQMVNDDHPMNTPDYKLKAEEIRRMAAARGVPINQTHAPFTFAKALLTDPVAYEEIVMPRLIRAIEITALLGGKVTAMHPLHYLNYAENKERVFEMNMSFYRRLLPYAKEYDVCLGIENMFQRDARRGCLTADTCSASAEYLRYIDTLDDPYAVALLDVGHVGLPAGTTEEAADIIRALGHDRLKALHIHDNNYKDDQHLPPFMGKMDWNAITKALGEIDYTGDFTFELSSAFMTAQNDDYLPIMADFLCKTGKYLMARIEASRPQK